MWSGRPDLHHSLHAVLLPRLSLRPGPARALQGKNSGPRGLACMGSLADRTIAALRANHDALAGVVVGLTDDQLGEPATVDVIESGLQLVVADGVSLAASTPGVTAELMGDLEVPVRLIGGRLDPQHTPEGVTVNGNVSLDDLRRVFPGF